MAVTFPLFAQLPTEIQLMIFEEAALEHTRDRVVVCTEGWGAVHAGQLVLLPTRTLLTPLMWACAVARRAHRNTHPMAVRVTRYDNHPAPPAVPAADDDDDDGDDDDGDDDSPPPRSVAPALDVYLNPARDVLWIASDTTEPACGPGTIFWGATRYHWAPVTPRFRAAWHRVLATSCFAGNTYEWVTGGWWYRRGFTGVRSAGAQVSRFPLPLTLSWKYPSLVGDWADQLTIDLWYLVDRDPGRNALAILTNPDYAHIIGPKLLNCSNHPAHRWS